eukprot:TRINITY_DN419_c1_g2_i2.p7 TRINITY_DN419_c1_g2~~TRINITY_DN419_c1_g2_i2.p7  ORF type:complete len:110 (+),score=1.64 TRINITY_DN419_c1_g2_i2:2422-2751(+)
MYLRNSDLLGQDGGCTLAEFAPISGRPIDALRFNWLKIITKVRKTQCNKQAKQFKKQSGFTCLFRFATAEAAAAHSVLSITGLLSIKGSFYKKQTPAVHTSKSSKLGFY